MMEDAANLFFRTVLVIWAVLMTCFDTMRLVHNRLVQLNTWTEG
jgi:hypothetical protein